MSCTPAMLESANDRLDEIVFNSFTASPNNLRPGAAVTLKWSIDLPEFVTLRLNGVTIAGTGSKTVNPVVDTRFTITAEPGCSLRRSIGSVLVNVDESSCRLTSIDEAIVRSLILAAVDTQISEHNAMSQNDLTKRRETLVEIDPTGIAIKIRLRIGISIVPDPDLDIDMKLGLGVGPGNSVQVFYKTFSTDVNWPWWFDGITAGISLIIDSILGDRIEAKLKPSVLNSMRARIAQTAGLIPGVLTRIATTDDAIQLTICG
jgi:hypothetical protein